MMDLAKKALGKTAGTGVDQAEAFAMISSSLRIKVYKQEVEELASSTGSGVGIRVFKGSSVGYAYTSDLSEDGLSRVAIDAAGNAAVTAGDEFSGLPEPESVFPTLDLFSEKLASTSVRDKIGLASLIERTALERDKRISQVEGATYAEGEGTVALANSLGFSGEFRETSCYAFVQTIAEQEGQMQTGLSLTTGREPGQLTPEEVGHEAADRAVSLLGAQQCESVVCPVVLDPFVTASVLAVVTSALTGEAVQKQRSMFAGKQNEAVASAIFNLTDDGTHPEGLASAPFDGEGVPTGQTRLIVGGELQGFLYDSYSARKDRQRSTGNAVRGSYRSMPRVGATNLTLTGGDRSLAEMIEGVDFGFYVMEVSGMHSGANAVSGDLSVGAAGRLIRGGMLAEPVREVTIAGNLLTMLGFVEAVGNDNRWVPFGGSIHAPSMLISKMSVSGK